jgi:hypothetical protein
LAALVATRPARRAGRFSREISDGDLRTEIHSVAKSSIRNELRLRG